MNQRNKDVATSRRLPVARGRTLEAAVSRAPGVRRVLLALSVNESPGATLWRAYSLSVLLDAELHLVRVVPPLPGTRCAFSRVERADVLGALKRMLEARRTTRIWLAAALGQTLPKGRFKVRGGAFFEQVAKRAVELDATLIVVSPGTAREGTRVTRLARVAHAPVLVAREVTSQRAVVAATDLSESGAAVLQSAAALCQRLDAPLVAVHNLTPVAVPVGPEAPIRVTLPLQRGVERLRRRALEEAAEILPADAETVLTKEIDPAQAILKEARTRDADLIVVGTRRRSWLDRLVGCGVSAQVVSQARRSVLVTPVACERDRARGTSRPRRIRDFFVRSVGEERPRRAGFGRERVSRRTESAPAGRYA